MTVNQIKAQDLDKIIHRAKQGSPWQGIVYSDNTWKILANITACTIEFMVKVQYKNGKFGMDKVIVRYNNNEYTANSYTGQLKLPVAVQNKIISIFKRFESTFSFSKKKQGTNNKLDTTYVDSDSNGHTISLKACFDTLVPASAKENHDYYIMTTDGSRGETYNKYEYCIRDIIQDKTGNTYVCLGNYSKFRFWKPRPAGNNTKTGLPGEDSNYLINVDYSGKFIYLPIISPETLKLFKKSFCHGIVKNIEQQVKKSNINYIKEIARDTRIEMVKGLTFCEQGLFIDCDDSDYEYGTYVGRNDKNMLGWQWQYDPYKSGDGEPEEFGEIHKGESRPIHW